MAMGFDSGEQPTLFLTHEKLKGLGHPFYDALNRLLREQRFDRFVVELCGPFYARAFGPRLSPFLWPFSRLFGGLERCSREFGGAPPR